jgi:hypothetical protein
MRHWSRLLDAAFVTALCLFSASLSDELLAELQATTIAADLPAAAMLACGHGLVEPASATPELRAFLRRERPSLSCAELAGDGRVARVNLDVRSTRYAVYSLAIAFRVGSISWRTADGYLAAMAGLSMALAYALFRLAVGPVLAAIGVAALILSSHTLAVGLEFRDYGKEFWFIAAWLALGWLLRRGRPRASPAIYLPAGAAGALLGIGLGFRVDLFVIIPAVVAVIVLALRGFDRPALTAKAIGAGAFVLTFVLVGAPILATFSGESSVSHVVVLGVMTPFTEALGIEAPPYDVGDLYADGFAAATIYAHARQVDHDRALGRLGTPAYDRQGVSLLKDLAWRFPADFVIRGLGAARQVIANPFDPDADAEATTIGALRRTPMRLRMLRVRAAADGWLHGHELLLMAAVFLAIAVRDRRLAFVAIALVLYFSSYSMLQFSRRHTFQLDVIPTGMVLIALDAGAALAVSALRPRLGAAKALARSVLFATLAGAALVAAAAAGLTLARAWQQRRVTTLLELTLASPSVDLITTDEALPFPVAHGGPRDTWDAIASWHYITWATPVLLRPAPGAWPAGDGEVLFHAEYLRIELGGAQCAPGIVPIVVKYSSVYRTTDSDYTREFNVPVTNNAQLLVPIFELPGVSHFEGLAVPAGRAACVSRVRRTSPADAVPLPNLFAVLQPDWRAARLYQRLRETPAPPGMLPITRR